MNIFSVELSKLDNISQDFLEELVSQKMGKKTETYYIFPTRLINTINQQASIWNMFIQNCQMRGFTSAMITNKTN